MLPRYGRELHNITLVLPGYGRELHNITLMLPRYGRELLDILGGQVSDLKNEALSLVMRVMEAIVRTCQVDGVMLIRDVLAVMASSEFSFIFVLESSYLICIL